MMSDQDFFVVNNCWRPPPRIVKSLHYEMSKQEVTPDGDGPLWVWVASAGPFWWQQFCARRCAWPGGTKQT
jgi:hypothetical protein